MKQHAYIVVALLGTVVMCSLSCRKTSNSPSKAVAQELDWTGRKMQVTRAKDGFFTVSNEYMLKTWKWNGYTLALGSNVQLPVVQDVVLLPGKEYIACKDPGDKYSSWPLVLRDLSSDKTITKWDAPSGWYYSHTGTSRNGNFAAIVLNEDPGNPAPDRDWENPRYRVGVIDVSKRQLRWIGDLRGNGGGTVSEVVASDDGRYVAVGGWNNGVAMADATKKKVVWIEHPAEAVSIQTAVFSPDSSRLYAGDDGGGCVYAFDTKTGNVIGRWYTTDTGQPGQSERVSSLAVSPDGSLVAAGTGPGGQVFLFNTASSGGKPEILAHSSGELCSIAVVSFSPDSTHLASAGKGKIRVWRLKP